MRQWNEFSNRMRPSAAALVVFLAGWAVFSLPVSYAQSVVAVVNAANLRTDQPVSAGSWVLGSGNFANVTLTVATSLPLPKSLGAVTITVGDVQAAIGSVSSTEVRFLIPYQTAPGLRAVVVAGPGGTANGTVRIINAAPGIFQLGTTDPPQGMILNQDNSNNSQSRPAIRGQLISIYATGHGALSQPISDGDAAPANPTITTQVNPQVFIGGVECAVEFSGLVPGVAGLWRIAARLPSFAFLAGKLPVIVFMNGVDSNEVTIYVAP